MRDSAYSGTEAEMSYTCKHINIKLVERTYSQCGTVFVICPVCVQRLSYSWLCEDCEQVERRKVREQGYTQDEGWNRVKWYWLCKPIIKNIMLLGNIRK